MIKITFLQKDKTYFQYTVKGHAFAANPGEDVVCASVSVLVQAAVNVLTDILHLEQWTEIEIDEGYLQVALHVDELDARSLRDSQIVFSGLVLNLQSIQKQHPAFVTMDFRRI